MMRLTALLRLELWTHGCAGKVEVLPVHAHLAMTKLGSSCCHGRPRQALLKLCISTALPAAK